MFTFSVSGVWAQGTLFVEGDKVGIGIEVPLASLHVQRTDGTAKLLVEEASATTNNTRTQFEMSNNGASQFALKDTNSGADWRFQNFNGSFRATLAGTMMGELELDGSGNLTIVGNLVTGGGGTCDPGPCDRTFVDYEVEPIEEHAAYMWENKHLWGVGPTPEGAPINISKKTTGILHELEKAHIYIEQLNNELKQKDERIGDLEARFARLEALIGASN